MRDKLSSSSLVTPESEWAMFDGAAASSMALNIADTFWLILTFPMCFSWSADG